MYFIKYENIFKIYSMIMNTKLLVLFEAKISNNLTIN